MKGKKCIKLLILSITCLLSLKLYLNNANALTANVSSAYVDFWSSSANQQVQSNVSLPWGANIGGSPSNKQSFYLNNISMTYPITASASDLSVYGRIVMRFSPSFTSGEDAYFCNYHLNSITNSVSNIQSGCNATITYNYADNTTYSVSLPIYFNYTLPSGALALYVDYNQNLPNTALSSITATFSKTGSWDIYSVTNGYSLILTVEPSEASYYITDSGGNVDLSPLVNQNQTIINQNQQIIDNQNQNTQDIIKSNQRCFIKNYFKVPETQTKNGVTLTKHSDGTFDLVGTATGNAVFTAFVGNVLDGGTYTLSKTQGRSFIASAVQDYNSNSWLSQLISLPANSLSVTNSITPVGNRTGFVIQALNGLTYDFHNVQVQLEKGSSATSFEPYNKEICQNYNEIMENKDNEDRNNLENQSQTTDSQADAASNAAETTGTTLFGAFTQLFNALSNVSGNSCTLPPIQIYSLNLGQMDLCTYNIPPQIMALVSIGMVFIIVPLGIHLVKKMINLYKEITG